MNYLEAQMGPKLNQLARKTGHKVSQLASNLGPKGSQIAPKLVFGASFGCHLGTFFKTGRTVLKNELRGGKHYGSAMVLLVL